MSEYFENFDTFEKVSLAISLICVCFIFLGFYQSIDGKVEWLYLSLFFSVSLWVNIEILIRRNERIEYERKELLDILELDRRFYKHTLLNLLNSKPNHYCRLEIEALLSAIYHSERIEEIEQAIFEKNKDLIEQRLSQ